MQEFDVDVFDTKDSRITRVRLSEALHSSLIVTFLLTCLKLVNLHEIPPFLETAPIAGIHHHPRSS